MHTAASIEHMYNNYPTAPSVQYNFCIYHHYVLVQIAILNIFVSQYYFKINKNIKHWCQWWWQNMFFVCLFTPTNTTFLPYHFYGGEHIDLQIWYTGEKVRNRIYGKKARLTWTKDASRLSSACLTKWCPIIRSPPPRQLTLPYCAIGWSSLTTDWTMLFWTPKRIAKQAKTLFCIGWGKVSHCWGAASIYSGSV